MAKTDLEKRNSIYPQNRNICIYIYEQIHNLTVIGIFRLTALEKMEEKSKDADVTINNEGDEEEVEVEEIDEDEEMDDGTDYANNYFDNGEDYEDEDDNLEDGPIY